MEIDRVNSNQISLLRLDEWMRSGREIPDEKILNYNGIKFLGQKESIHPFTTFLEHGFFLEDKAFLSDTPIQKWSLRYEEFDNDRNTLATVVDMKMSLMLTQCDHINGYATLPFDDKSEKIKKELPEHSKYISRNLLILKTYVQRNGFNGQKLVQSEKYKQLLDIAAKYRQGEFYTGEIDAYGFKKQAKEEKAKEKKAKEEKEQKEKEAKEKEEKKEKK